MPSANEFLPLCSLTVLTALTVTVATACWPLPDVAVTSTMPIAFPVTRPVCGSTVATSGLALVQTNVVTVGFPFASNGAATSCFVSPTFSDHSAGVSVMLATGGGGMMVMLTAAVLVMPFATAVAVSVTGVAFATNPFTTPALSTVATDGLLDTQEIFALPMKTFAASRPDASKSVLVPSARVVSPPVMV